MIIQINIDKKNGGYGLPLYYSSYKIDYTIIIITANNTEVQFANLYVKQKVVSSVKDAVNTFKKTYWTQFSTMPLAYVLAPFYRDNTGRIKASSADLSDLAKEMKSWRHPFEITDPSQLKELSKLVITG